VLTAGGQNDVMMGIFSLQFDVSLIVDITCSVTVAAHSAVSMVKAYSDSSRYQACLSDDTAVHPTLL